MVLSLYIKHNERRKDLKRNLATQKREGEGNKDGRMNLKKGKLKKACL